MGDIIENTYEVFNSFIEDEISYSEFKNIILENQNIDINLMDYLIEEFKISDKQKKMLGKMAVYMAGGQAAKYVAGYPGLASFIAANMLYKHLKHNNEKKKIQQKLNSLNPRRMYK